MSSVRPSVSVWRASVYSVCAFGSFWRTYSTSQGKLATALRVCGVVIEDHQNSRSSGTDCTRCSAALNGNICRYFRYQACVENSEPRAWKVKRTELKMTSPSCLRWPCLSIGAHRHRKFKFLCARSIYSTINLRNQICHNSRTNGQLLRNEWPSWPFDLRTTAENVFTKFHKVKYMK